jgi:hypothetical protein
MSGSSIRKGESISSDDRISTAIKARHTINQVENTLSEFDFMGFIKEKLQGEAERLIAEKQAQGLREKLEEMRKEKKICQMMLRSLQEVPTEKYSLKFLSFLVQK